MGMSRLVTLCGALLLTACAAQPPYTVSRVGQQIPVGSRLEIGAPITYPAGRDTLWFQGGEIVASRHINTWLWHCSLDLRFESRGDLPRHLEQGRFVVSGIREERLDFPVPGGSILDGDSDYLVGVVFDLASTEHPDIKALRCERRFTDWSQERAITLADVEQQLGGYLRFSPASP
ncbi:MAG: hypothetical protein Kow006_03920 [Gammaproteobacteria bacterium]